MANEFARARVSLDRRGHHLRLRVEDQRSGATVLLDALDLVSLARADRSDLDALVFGDEYRATIDDPQADGGGDHGG